MCERQTGRGSIPTLIQPIVLETGFNPWAPPGPVPFPVPFRFRFRTGFRLQQPWAEEEQGGKCWADALQVAAGLWDALISQVAMVRKE